MKQILVTEEENMDFEQLKPQAENGDPHAQFLLAYIYLTEKEDKETAFKWLMKAAEGGDAEALASVAGFYETGTVVKKDWDTAEVWLAKAVAKGSVNAMVRLSRHIAGKDKQEALRLAKKAAEAGNTDAYRLLGNYYLHGVSGSVSIAQAMDWYKKGADAGDNVSIQMYESLSSEQRKDITELLPELPANYEPDLISEDFEKVKHELYLASKRGDQDADTLLEKVDKYDHSRAKMAYFCPGMIADTHITEHPIFKGSPKCPSREHRKSLMLKVAGAIHNDYGYSRSIVEGHTCYEPDNTSDPDAVALIADNGHKIGYIPRKKQDLYESTFFGDNVCFVAFLNGISDQVILFTQDNRRSIWSEYKRLLGEYLHIVHHHELRSHMDWIDYQNKQNNR